MNILRLFRPIVLSTLFVALICFGGCKKKGADSGSVPDKFELTGELLGKIPANSFGFFQWDSTHGAYQKLLKSPWSGSGDFLSVAQKSQKSKAGSKMGEALKKAGLSLDDETTLQQVFAKAVAFAALSEDKAGQKGPDMGVVFRSTKDFDPVKALLALRAEMEKGGVVVEDLSAPGVSGMSFELPCDESQPECKQRPPVKLSVGTKDGLTVLANRAAVVAEVHANDGSKKPAIIDSSRLKRATEGLPGNTTRFAFGFVDLATFLQQSEEVKAQFKGQELSSMETLALSFAMKDTPESDMRVLFDPNSPSKLFEDGRQPASGEQLFTALPEKPIIFLSFDGQLLRSLRDMAIASQKGDSQQFAQQLAFLDNIGRVGIVATLATPGTSFLPIPNFMLMIESSQAEQVTEQLRSVVTTAMGSSGMGTASAWTEKDLGGIKAYSMQGTLGIGVHIASKQGLVLLSTSEPQLSQGLQSSASTFLGNLNGQAKQVFTSQPTVGNFYLDFDQVASFMETMGGVLSLYAPQDKNAAELLKPENIKSLRQMGAMIGSVEQKKDMVRLRSFYQNAIK